MLDTELEAEQAHLDRAYGRLEVLQQKAMALATSEYDAHSKTPAAMLERDAREFHGARRYGSLRIDGGLCFGRIDDVEGNAFHIGRVGVAEDDLTPLVIDWRAPVAEPFYRATPLDPLGLVRRRHLLTRGRRVVGLEDEPLDIDAEEARRRGLVLVGEAALLSALTERRTGRMRDIVATIQAEQDEIIRAPLNGVLVVQGGPGTGKTAVALHRAAFLLYRHRFPLEEQGVLVLGPNPLFLRYIERVLPSLGESRCRMATAHDLHRVRPDRREADAATSALKGDIRMATVIANAVASRERALPRTTAIGVGSFRLRIGPGATARIVETAKARPGLHNERRPFVARLVVRHLMRQYNLAVERARNAGLPVTPIDDGEVKDRLESAPDVRRILDRIWPVLTAERLLTDLFAHEPLLREAAAGVLSDQEWPLLQREESSWTESDIPLLDEADALLGAATRSRRKAAPSLEDASAMVDRVLAGHIPDCPECDQELTYRMDTRRLQCGTFECGADYEPEEVMSPAAAVELRDLQRVMTDRARGDVAAESDGPLPAYGHVVVDEAQELSAMQWRLISRRCPIGSMTIVGDLAQGSGPTAAAAWADVFDAIGTQRGRVVELTVNYRTPAEVMALADRLGGAATARCVRESGEPPVAHPSTDPCAINDVVEQEIAAVAGGKVAVVAPTELVPTLRDRLALAAGDELDAEVSVLDGEAAKGLEFDSVIVVEPSSFDDRSLYVALTRTTRRLVMVHSRPLPAPLCESG